MSWNTLAHTHIRAQRQLPGVCVLKERMQRAVSVLLTASEWERQIAQNLLRCPPPHWLLLAKGSSLTVCVVRGFAYTTHLFPLPAWQVLATGQPLKVLLGEVVGVSWDNLGHRFRGLCISSLNGGSRTTSRTLSQRTGKDSCLQPCYFNCRITQKDWHWYQHFIK